MPRQTVISVPHICAPFADVGLSNSPWVSLSVAHVRRSQQRFAPPALRINIPTPSILYYMFKDRFILGALGVSAFSFLITYYVTHRPPAPAAPDPPGSVFMGAQQEEPGRVHHIKVSDLPAPAPDQSVDNGPDVVARPANAWPQVPPGFKVSLYVEHLHTPRLIRTAPNGDLFVAESYAGNILVLRGVDKDGHPQQSEVFATGLNKPFGIAFYPSGPNPQWVYIGETDAVIRFPYHVGDMKATGAPQHIADLPGGGHLRGGGHWTRTIVFSKDDKKMFVSVGSYSNVDDTDNNPREYHRADILEFNPDGSGERVYAYGIRNAVGLAINP
ncbi:MAG: PQQ-dependent sugar dehydrogenase, partial [Terriglobia bacterium]|nr:PQQ-dependent sugar dehydrogenase [Terriglobia bacterium]